MAGQLFAMTGATVAHNRIARGLYSRLLAAAGDACQVFISDVRLRADTLPTYYYPDVMVVCDPADDDRVAKTRPCLLAEVLSPAMEATERREKLAAYRRLSSLRECLLLAQGGGGSRESRGAETGLREPASGSMQGHRATSSGG